MTAELVLQAGGATDVGQRRTHNEDTVLVRDDLSLYLVADGAGGHNAGDVASALCARSMSNYFGATVRSTHESPEFNRFGIPNGARRLSAAVLKANRDIVEISHTSSEHRGMGTTVVAACFSPRSGLMHVAHVGDSRCYRLRGGHLELLTKDHSLLTDVIEQRPELDDQVLARLPKNVVTRALGMDGQLRVSIRSYAVVEGDRYLLCSDGLSGPVSAPEIATALAREELPTEIAQRLIQLANDAGGPDNIAVLVLHCHGGHVHALPADSVPPPPPELFSMPGDYDNDRSDPELLILGIEDLDLTRGTESASDDLLKALGDLIGPKE
ncbi:MAG TPA: protein phosphatase 2C domain-containing protein [Polyangiaceae bacterium]|jgi:serine/threonine protein phosphatase PrpC|nr:protein phosphatase 2C domain-containing protein [Polyangiaceae bacterium]